MYRAVVRSSPIALRAIRTSPASRRFLSTAPADKRSTWKGAAARWGLAVAAVYWYNTSPIFADEPISPTVPAPSQFSDADLPTVEAVIEQKRRETRASSVAPLAETPEPSVPVAEPSVAGLESPEALEQEAGQQGAFNPETGEINWDCPCLGGMADGPCGEDFKAAFSCFVFSEAEPKGMDCIDKFQHMQDCFRQYPDIYGAELQEDDDEPIAGDAGDTPEPLAGTEALASTGPVATTQETLAQTAQKADRQLPVESTEDVQVPKDEHPGIPTAAVDATTANDGKIAEAPGKQ